MAECNGICLTPADVGLPEYSSAGIAYAHPNCPEHGDLQEEDSEETVCGRGDESLRYVRADGIETEQS
jgi:hypothetical protein